MPVKDAVNGVADRLAIPEEIRQREVEYGGRPFNAFSHRVRWVRQDGIRRGFISKEERGFWMLSDKGKAHLENCRPGIVVVIYETETGMALWAGAQSASAVINDKSLNLIFTSPPYPLLKPKAYGNLAGQEYIDWICSLAGSWRQLLVDDGSLVLNLADTWERGRPTLSLYQERILIKLVDELGYHLAQKFVWHNPNKIPSSEWVTIRRVRVRNSVENFYWLSKNPNPKADNRRILGPYSDRMKRLIARGGERRHARPSGHGGTIGAFGKDNGGTIPPNLFVATNSVSNDRYCRSCREHNLEVHPARFPSSVCETLIQLLTDRGDRVADFFSGSNVIGEICERTGREWVAFDRSLNYLKGSKFRFEPETIKAYSLH